MNPVLVLAPIDGMELKGFAGKTTAERFGCEPVEVSPAHHVKAGVPVPNPNFDPNAKTPAQPRKKGKEP